MPIKMNKRDAIVRVAAMKRKAQLICKRPDHDVPELLCGTPLPCRWHTVIIDTESTPPTVTIPATAAPQMTPNMLGLLKQIARDIDPKSVKKRKPAAIRGKQ